MDEAAIKELFAELDTDGNGSISFDELKRGLRKLNVAPSKKRVEEKGLEKDLLRRA